MAEGENNYQSIQSTGPMSRQGSIFYDAPETLNAVFLNENKNELEKMVS
jgi:hypothetical protein